MSESGRLLVKPRVCDRCGRCLRACPLGALRVGRSYIMVDWARCDACGRCVRVCGTGALALAGAAAPKAAAAPRAAAPAYRRREPAARGAAAAGVARASARAAAAPKAVHAATAGEPFAWSLLEAAATLSVTFSAFMAKEALLASRAVAALPPDRLVPLRSGVLAVYYALQLALLWWLVRRRGGSFAEAFSLTGAAAREGGWLRSAGLVAAGLVLTRVLATGYGLLTQRFGLTPAAGTDTVTRVFGTAPAGLTLAVVMLVFVGPFVEELVFRGALQRGLESRLGVWPAIVAQALLFAAFHRSWWLLVPMTLLGVALGWLARQRRSLWPPIALHALYNALSVAAVLAAVSAAR